MYTCIVSFPLKNFNVDSSSNTNLLRQPSSNSSMSKNPPSLPCLSSSGIVIKYFFGQFAEAKSAGNPKTTVAERWKVVVQKSTDVKREHLKMRYE